MGRIYTVGGENFTISTGKPLLVISSAASGAGSQLAIHRIEVGQNGTVTSAQIRAALSRRTAGSTVTATNGLTPKPLTPLGGPASGIASGTAAAAGTAGGPVTTDTTPTYVDDYVMNFNNLNGWLYVPTPPEEHVIPPSTVWVFRTLADPATLTGWTIMVTFEEVV
jgi:hypothetical protein